MFQDNEIIIISNGSDQNISNQYRSQQNKLEWMDQAIKSLQEMLTRYFMTTGVSHSIKSGFNHQLKTSVI
jgi:hypothetical protein